MLLAVSSAHAAGAEEAPLEERFADPPTAQRPGVFWTWFAGNISRSGITKDLEWMARTGLRRATIFHLGEHIGGDPVESGPHQFNTPEWKSMVRYAAKEADRLGITLGMHNCDGWGTTGGPWIKPEDSMKQLTYDRARVTGGSMQRIELPRPLRKYHYYEDIALLAYPAKEAERLEMHSVPRIIEWHAADGRKVDIHNPAGTWKDAVNWRDYGVKQSLPLSALTDGNRTTEVLLPTPPLKSLRNLEALTAAGAGPQNKGSIVIRFDEAIPAAAVTAYPFEHRIEWYGPNNRGTMVIEARGKEGRWKKLAEAPAGLDLKPCIAEFEPVRSDAFRITFYDMHPSKRWMWWVAFSEFEILAPGEQSLVAPRIADTDAKAAMNAVIANPRPSQPINPGAILDKKSIVDLTDKLRAGVDTIEWEVPEGEWVVLRMGYTTSGKTNHPPTDAGRGLECDKLHPSGVEAHWEGFVSPLLDELEPYVGRSFTRWESDSWECGAQNWTHDLERTFETRYGYSLIPYLPVVAGEAVGSVEDSEQALRDWRMLLSELITRNFYQRYNELCASRGLKYEAEMAGAQAVLADPIAYASVVALPMTEFWSYHSKEFSLRDVQGRRGVMDAISGAHLSGKFVVAAEAFTSGNAHFLHEPATLKPSADAGFCAGLNYYYHHASGHQPDESQPGWNMDPWGIVFNRKLTWAEEASSWNAYLARCQTVLQAGKPVVDILYLKNEDATNFLWKEPDAPFSAEGHPFIGYKFHSLSHKLLHRLSAKEGKLVTPEGMRYALIYTPEHEAYSIETLEHLLRLKREGGVVIGKAPEGVLGKNPDRQHGRELIEKIWDGTASSKMSLVESARAAGIEPAMTFTSPDPDSFVDFNHRRIGDAEVFFLFNRRDRLARAELSFRVEGKIPEIWRADTGERFRVGRFEAKGGRTVIPLEFGPFDSCFIVFRNPEDSTAPTRPNYGQINWPKASGEPDRFTQQAELKRARSELSPSDGPRRAAPQLREAASGPRRLREVAARGTRAEAAQGAERAQLKKAWTLVADPITGPAHPAVQLEGLQSWSAFESDAIRYLAGKGVYHTEFELSDAEAGSNLYLDLGEVHNIAAVRLNGKDLGTLWKRPFRIPLYSAARAGVNELVITVTNLWPNRLIGDARAPADFRATWTNNDSHWNADDELIPAGLLGPVKLLRAK